MNKVEQYQKKPVVIEAIQWTGDNFVAIDEFITISHSTFPKDGKIIIPTLEGDMIASIDDWIIKGVNGEFYPCKPNIFEKTYQLPTSPKVKVTDEEIMDKADELYNDSQDGLIAKANFIDGAEWMHDLLTKTK